MSSRYHCLQLWRRVTYLRGNVRWLLRLLTNSNPCYKRFHRKWLGWLQVTSLTLSIRRMNFAETRLMHEVSVRTEKNPLMHFPTSLAISHTVCVINYMIASCPSFSEDCEESSYVLSYFFSYFAYCLLINYMNVLWPLLHLHLCVRRGRAARIWPYLCDTPPLSIISVCTIQTRPAVSLARGRCVPSNI